ncbi:quinone oxidoreductase-like protein 1 [Lycorma delicatula]|uniref:quinone oxidoreductase-like protein 1 n=1 Tax=Lycorma delicatula TaxID=130591 RepID=UPI003F5173C3
MSSGKTGRSVFMELDNVGSSLCFVMFNEEKLPELGKYGVLIEVKACGLSLPTCDITALSQTLRKAGKKRLAAGQDVAGIVRSVGTDVTGLRIGDQVVGIIPLDYEQSGFAEKVVLQEFDIVLKPNSVNFVDAVGCIGEGVKSYLALHYLGRLVSGNTVLVINGASPLGSACIQLAHHWGARVIATCSSSDEKLYLQTLGSKLEQLVDIVEQRSELKAACLKQTANLGFDIIIDQRTTIPSQMKNILTDDINMTGGKVDDDTSNMLTNHEIISCLAVGGHWITTNPNMQLDPPHSQQLSLRCGTLGFLMDQAWLISGSFQGKYQHILMDLVEKISTYILRPNIHHTVNPDGLLEACQDISELNVGKIVFTTN